MARSALAPWAEEVSPSATPMSADDLARLPDDAKGLELVDGRLVRMTPPGGEHGSCASVAHVALAIFVEARRLGRILSAETGFWVSQPDKLDTVLAPDVAFVRHDRVPPRGSAEWRGYWRLAPDLVVEVPSPSQSRFELAEKARLWLSVGTRLVWVIWPDTQQVDVWSSGQIEAHTLSATDSLDGMDVLPGFALPVASLFQ